MDIQQQPPKLQPSDVPPCSRAHITFGANRQQVKSLLTEIRFLPYGLFKDWCEAVEGFMGHWGLKPPEPVKPSPPPKARHAWLGSVAELVVYRNRDKP